MTPPSVLLDATFLDALTSTEHEWRAVARDTYATLVDRYENHEVRLRARADHLRRHPLERKGLLAPVESISVARQYQRAAQRLENEIGVDHEVAVTLVIMRREKIRRIATFESVFSAFDDVEVVRRDSATDEPPISAES